MTIKTTGLLYIISGPSGTGKTTLIKNILNNQNYHPAISFKNIQKNLQLSISYTTRKPRDGEISGKDYHFISKKKFQKMIDNNMFFEYAQVFNYYYGTEKNSIQKMLQSGIHIILNIDWQGAKQIRCQVPHAYTIFILPPSKYELERRLRTRKKDTEKTIITRMQQAISEITHIKEYDYIIVNDNLQTALIHLQSIILSEQLRVVYQTEKYNQLINSWTL